MANPLQAAGAPNGTITAPLAAQKQSTPIPAAAPQPQTDFEMAMNHLKSGGYLSHLTGVPVLPQLTLTQEERYQIAFFIASQRSTAYVCANFELFGLTDENYVTQLILFVAKKDLNAICNVIGKLNLPERVRITLAEMVAADPTQGWYFAMRLDQWKITDQKALLKLAGLVALRSPVSYPYFQAVIPPSKERDLLEKTILETAIKTGVFFSKTEDFKGLFPEYEKAAAKLLPHLRNKIAAVPNALAKAQLEIWLLTQQMRLLALIGPQGVAVLDAKADATLNAQADASLDTKAGASSKTDTSLDTKAGAYLEALCEQLMEYRVPEERIQLSSLLFKEFAINPSSLQRWIATVPLNQDKQIHTHTLILQALVVCMLPEKENAFAKQFGLLLAKERKALRYGPSLSVFIKGLLAFSQLPQERRRCLLNHIFYKTEDCIARLRFLNIFINLQDPALFENKTFSLIELEALRKNFLARVFEINAQEVALYDTLIGKWRDSAAPLVYAGKLHSLDDAQRQATQAAYNKFISHVLNGNLRQLRRATCHLAHLEKLAPHVVQKWTELLPTAAPLPGYLPKTFAHLKPQERFHQFLQQTLERDNHVQGWKVKMPLLARCLLQKENAEVLLKELSTLPITPENKIQQSALNLLTKQFSPSLLVELASRLNEGIFEQWKADLEEFTQAFDIKVENYQTWSIGITDDPCDLMLLAKETGGCQSIDGSPQLNKCALAYMMDGKNLPIYIRGSDGKLKARAVLRLLHHKQLSRPVLFLERHYNSAYDPLLSKALNAYAIELAQKLDLPLFTKEALVRARNDQLHLCTLESLGSNAPFEYSDAGGGGSPTKGVFTIDNPYAMFMPLKVMQPLRAIHDPNAIAFARHFGL